MDNELFELCKEVYEKTGWDKEPDGRLYIDKCYWTYKGRLMDSVVQRYKLLSDQFVCPEYTSDYLLEKLPRNINEATNELLVSRWGSRWRACYMPINLGHFPEQRTEADTPLKALLMLAIALDDAGQLVAAETTA